MGTFKMVACYRMSSQILNKVSRSTLLRQRCLQFSTSQYRNGGGGGTTDIDANPNYHKNPSDNPWRQVEPYLDVAQRIKSPLEHYRPSPWEQNFGTNYIRSVVIALGLWTCFWAHHSYNDILEETKKERKQYFAKMGREDWQKFQYWKMLAKANPKSPWKFSLEKLNSYQPNPGMNVKNCPFLIMRSDLRIAGELKNVQKNKNYILVN